MISARDVLFDEEEFYDGKLIRFTDTLISELDEAITKVAIAPNRNLDGVQLREDDSDVEDTEDIQDVRSTAVGKVGTIQATGYPGIQE